MSINTFEQKEEDNKYVFIFSKKETKTKTFSSKYYIYYNGSINKSIKS